jgi:hypothetical protein
MKTPNSAEDQMRSWTPRRPSRQIEQKLFGTQNTGDEVETRRRSIHLPWYQTLGASVAGCAVVLFTIFNFIHLGAIQRISTPFSPLSNHMSSLAMASAPVNSLTAPILGWTNDGTVGSSIRPFDLLNTNLILP